MNRILPVAYLASIFLAGTGRVSADVEFGADAYVNNALRVELVRAQGNGETADFPAPRGMRRVLVDH